MKLITFVVLLLLSSAASSSQFPSYGLEKTVAFWKSVFIEHSEQDTVFHCKVDMPTEVIFVRSFPTDHNRSAEEGQLRKELSKSWNCEVRSQRGLRERTYHALKTSHMILPDMERIFVRHGLPIELTRIPFLESSFNVRAKSKVGAVGMWQFMPASARMYGLKVNKNVDQRYDPILSTEAAALHLKDNYRVLQNWPLAVVAYNHGQAGIRRGVQATNEGNIKDLIERYESKSFKFASKNFYPEFLAVVEIYNDYQLCNR